MESYCSSDEACLPHLASIVYFRSPPKSRASSSFRQSMSAPTPRKMAAVGGLTPNKGHSRRCSSIPRPTSKLTTARTSSPHVAAMTANGCTVASMATPQTLVKPRTYSRTRRSSFAPYQSDLSRLSKTSRSRPPRFSLPATSPQRLNDSTDLSGTRQQLPLSHYSCHSLVSLDAMVASTRTRAENKAAASLHLPSQRTISNTSSANLKLASPKVSQRQLMGPLGPPMPRSQTLGNLNCFAASVANTPSPLKSTTRTISTVSQKSELGVMDALAESRMTDKEIECFNQVGREVKANRERMKGRNRAVRVSSKDTGLSLAVSKTMTFCDGLNGSSDQPVDGYTDMMIGDSSKKLPFQGAKLKIMSRSNPLISPPVLTPDSGVSMGSNSGHGWEIDVKLVYSHEPVQYWRGRFSTLSDRLRSEEYCINSPNFASTATSMGVKSTSTPKMDKSDSFEIDDIRRCFQAIEELRACCRTAEAIRSFEDFVQEVDTKQERSATRRQCQLYAHSVESKARIFSAGFRPKILGTDKNITAATTKMITAELNTKASMTRSKTTGDMTQPSKIGGDGTKGKEAKTGWRRPSYLKAHEEVLASEVALSAERHARAVAAEHGHARRSGIGVGVAISSGVEARAKMVSTATKPVVRHNGSRKSSGTSAGSANNAEMLKRVFSESVRSVRRMGRSFTGTSGSGDG